MGFQWQDGDTVLTFGSRDLWPPDPMRLFSNFVLYPKIERYSQWRWEGRFRGFPVPTHVLVYLPVGDGKEFFEFTFPKAKWTPLEAVTDSGRPYTVHRYAYGLLNRDAMVAKALEYEGSWYDVGDLRNMDHARQLGWVRFAGRTEQWFVCSSGAGLLHVAGGAVLVDEVHRPHRVLEPDHLDPAFYLAHQTTSWRMLWKQPLNFGR